jgi:hypothetical protein
MEQLNYKPLGKLVLLKPMEMLGKLDLSMIKEWPLDLPVAAIGEEVTKVKVGDRVVSTGNAMTLLVDGVKYMQVYESQIVGVALNGAKIETQIDKPNENF